MQGREGGEGVFLLTPSSASFLTRTRSSVPSALLLSLTAIPAKLSNMTIAEALAAGNGMMFYINTTTNYDKYIEQCQPTSCTYYDSEISSRIVHALTLASALLGTIVRLARPLFVWASIHCHRGY